MDYIYGEISKSVQKVTYTGVQSDTANVLIDNDNNTIKVDVNKFSFDSLDIPLPEEDGIYLLRATIKNGKAVYDWVSEHRYLCTLPIAGQDTISSGTVIAGNVVTGD